MKYIRNNKLFLGTKLKIIKSNLQDIIQYIYYQYKLDYNKMDKIYKHIESENDYDCIYDRHKPNNIIFENNPIEDNKYIYKWNSYFWFDDNEDYYKNEKLINELHNYLCTNKLKDLKFNNINKMKLINDCGIYNSIWEIRNLDWKLHFWNEYIINKKSSVRFHDLIIALYKIKSHKFDLWNEYYTGITELDISKNKFLSINKKELVMVINFDHYLGMNFPYLIIK